MRKNNIYQRMVIFIIGLFGMIIISLSINLISAKEHVHNQDCGYVEETIEQPCNHKHDATCQYVKQQEGILCNQGCIDNNGDGIIEHNENCDYLAPIMGHVCNHEHNDECGYVDGSNGQPCQYEKDKELVKDTNTIDNTKLDSRDSTNNTMTYTELKALIKEKTAYEYNENPQPIDLQGKIVIFEAGEYIGSSSYDFEYVPLIIRNATFKRAETNVADYMVYVTSGMGKITFENIIFDNSNITTSDAAIKIGDAGSPTKYMTITNCTFKNFISNTSSWGNEYANAIYSDSSSPTGYTINIDGIRFENCYNNYGLLCFKAFFTVNINDMVFDGQDKSRAINMMTQWGEKGKLNITNSNITNCVEGIVTEGGQLYCDNLTITNCTKGIETNVYPSNHINSTEIKNSNISQNDIGVYYRTINNMILSGKTIISNNSVANLQLDSIDKNKVKIKNLLEGSNIGIGVIPGIATNNSILATKDIDYSGDIKDSLSYFYSDHKNYVLAVEKDDIVLKAKETCTVNFDTNGGNSINSQTMNKGELIVEPELVTKDGYIFDGWYQDSVLTNPWDFTKDTVDNSMTLYAKWNVVKYTITYLLNDGVNHNDNPAEYNIESEQIIIKNPSKTGCIFLGWTSNSITTPTKNISIDKGSLGNLEFQAHWIPLNCLVTFYDEQGLEIDKQEIRYQSLLNEPVAPNKKGYQFMGWYTDQTYLKKWDFSTDRVQDHMSLYAFYKEVVETPQADISTISKVEIGTLVSLFTNTTDAKIYYTLDGTAPTNKSMQYVRPIIIQQDITIKAIALKDNCIDSVIATFAYRVSGDVKVDVEVTGDGTIQLPEDNKIIDAVLEQEDYQDLNTGKDILITIKCETIVSPDIVLDSSLLENRQIGQYMDISIYKQIGNNSPQLVTNLHQAIDITVEIPDRLLPSIHVTRMYSLLRIHDNEQIILKDKDQVLETVTVSTDRFSTYILLYNDIVSNNPTTPNTVEKSVDTGDSSNNCSQYLMGLCSSSLLFILFFRKK